MISIILCGQMFPTLFYASLLQSVLMSLDISPFDFKHFFALWPGMCALTFYVHCSGCGATLFLQEALVSFIGKWCTRIKMWALGVLLSIESLSSCSFSEQNWEIPLLPFIYLYVYSVCSENLHLLYSKIHLT